MSTRASGDELIESINEEFAESLGLYGIGVIVQSGKEPDMLRVEIHTSMGAPLMFCDIFRNAQPSTVCRVLRATVDAIASND